MLHLPQVYSPNSYKAKGLFRIVTNSEAGPNYSISIKAIKPYIHPWNSSFHKSTPCPIDTRTQHLSHQAQGRFNHQSLPGNPYKNWEPSETCIAVTQTGRRWHPNTGQLKPRVLGLSAQNRCPGTEREPWAGEIMHGHFQMSREQAPAAQSSDNSDKICSEKVPIFFVSEEKPVWKLSKTLFKCFSAHVNGVKAHWLAISIHCYLIPF